MGRRTAPKRGTKRAAGTACCGKEGRTSTRAPKARGGGASTRGGTVEDDGAVHDVCLASISLYLDGVRTRYGFVEDASLRTRQSDDVSRSGSTADVAVTDEYTLKEVVELCDDPASKVLGVVVNVLGLSDDALHAGKVRCWFVYASTAGGVDYTESAGGAGHTWARLRYNAPPEEAGHPLYRAANFLKPACMTSTCNLGSRELSGGCQQTAVSYCSRPGNIHSQWCANFFASPDGNADAMLESYCEKAVAEVLKDGGRLRDLDPRDRRICGCFYPPAVYTQYFKHLKGKSHVTAPCAFSPCANSRAKPHAVKSGRIKCPDVIECNQRCEIHAAGSLENVRCNQTCDIKVAETSEKLNAGADVAAKRARSYTKWKKRTHTASNTGSSGDATQSPDTDSERADGHGMQTAAWVLGGILLACLVIYAVRSHHTRPKPRKTL